uniref:Uncharacterized protein n=1 Tax=Eutreptiella gymnastica TaxID=73025 RepID=A0A7S1J2B9_9EUGL|mmetsp:Transcript_59645/g.106358  ORF Transcript_59645/g.106358 Transcript_59645/m.106358 type:complete len:100 (+) Transcript_59645:388-687(+)
MQLVHPPSTARVGGSQTSHGLPKKSHVIGQTWATHLTIPALRCLYPSVGSQRVVHCSDPTGWITTGSQNRKPARKISPPLTPHMTTERQTECTTPSPIT